MNIDIKLDKTFTEELTKLKAEYGEKFARLNGLADEQLNYTDFIDFLLSSIRFSIKPFLSVCVKNEHELADCCACLKGEGHWLTYLKRFS